MSVVVGTKNGSDKLPWERDARWQCVASAPGNLDLDARRVELSAASGVLRVEDVGLVKGDDLNAKDVLP